MNTSSAGLFKGSLLSALDQGVICPQSSYHHSLIPPFSGLVAYRELTEAGLDVRIFERDSVPGGNWHYSEEVPLDAPAPNAPTAISDFMPFAPSSRRRSAVFRRVRGRRQDLEGSYWAETTMGIIDFKCAFPFATGGWNILLLDSLGLRVRHGVHSGLLILRTSHSYRTPELSHYQLRNYVRSYASYLNINSNDENPATAYNIRVERIEKANQSSRARTRLETLAQVPRANSV
ncbi:hypothetical protein J3R82DRAFT_8419 [Butyriboletus roseoflavus]|nr:hypothetical protein J3R82DRAFT_8419 [Butyriboletus roseoflavus]